ncbi:hypothetical protein C8R42DRAFT_640192 [Lentinula raphanica]|nr:hypothetical protein C8R42DRAFT_640192 [Lentinula raphanica]
MSRFIVSFSKEETEAALAYYSSNATQFPPLVSEFFQALLRQVSQESCSGNLSQETNQCNTSTDIQSSTTPRTRTSNNSLHIPRLSQTISPYLLTPSPSPPRMFPEDGKFQTMSTSPNDPTQTTFTTNQTQRGDFSMPTSSPSLPRIFQHMNSVQSRGTRLPSVEPFDDMVNSENTGQKDSPSCLPTASSSPSSFPQNGDFQKVHAVSKDFASTTHPASSNWTWGFSLPKPSPSLSETRLPSPPVGSVSVDNIWDLDNTAQTVDSAGQESRDGGLLKKGLQQRKRKRPTVTETENDEYVEELDFEQDDLTDDGEEEDDENDGDYVEGDNGGNSNGSRGGRSSRGGRGGRGNTAGRRGQGSRSRGRRGGGGGNCSRNGANVSRRPPGRKSRSDALENNTDIPGAPSTYVGTGDSTGARGETHSNNSFIYSPDRAAPSREVQQESTLLLLALSSSPNSLDWVEEFVKAIQGEPWAETDSLISESLKNLALRCSRSKNMDAFATFCRMLNELMFAAKVNSIIHAQRRAFPSKTPSIKGILDTLKQEGFSERELGIWMSSGTRWARVAGAAEKRLSYRWGREISSATLVEACHQMRSPSNNVTLGLVRDGLIPIIVNLQKAIVFTIPILFSYNTREIYRLPPVMNIAQIEETDWYFDLFYYRIAVNVPRCKELWKEILEIRPSVENVTSFYTFNQRHLNSSSKSTLPAIIAWDFDDGPLSDEEMEDAISVQNPQPLSVLPPVTFAGFAGEILETNSEKWGPLYVVKASFNSRKVLQKGERPPFSLKNRNSWTESQRKIALNGERPQTLQEFSVQVRQRYDPVTGAIRAKQKWLFLTQEAIGGREVKVVDEEDRTLLTVDSTLPEEHRKCLWNAITAFCHATGVNLLNRDTSVLESPPIFQVWHLSYYARFGQSGKPIPKDFHPLHIKRSDDSKVNHGQFFVRASRDLQVFGKEFVAVSEAIGEILQIIVEKRIERDQDLFGKDVEAMIDIMPLHDFTPVRPFTGLVVNVNSATAAHKDAGDLGGCFPRLAVETRNGDVVSFKSQDYFHFNLHYKGDRCSVVVQADKSGLAYLKDSNGWQGNPWVM